MSNTTEFVKAIPSSEFRHIDRTDGQPLAECFVCQKRVAFRHYYGMPVCFVCEQNTSNIATWHELRSGLGALSAAMNQHLAPQANRLRQLESGQ